MSIEIPDPGLQHPSLFGSRLQNLIPRTAYWRVAAVIALVLILIGGAGAAYFGTRDDGLPQGVAFRVEGTSVTDAQIEQRMRVLQALYGISAPKGARAADAFRRDSAKAVAVSVILAKAASDRHIVIAEKSARDTLSKMIDTQLSNGRASFVQLLETYGASENDVLAEIMRQQSVDELYAEVTAGSASSVTDADVRAYFAAHQSQLGEPQQRSVQNIVVAARSQALTIFKEARAGANFATLVKKYSLDGSTMSTNGKLGFVTKAQLDDQYAALAFATPVGAVFGPVQTPHGWNVGRILGVRSASAPTFAQAKASIYGQLSLDAAYAAWAKWLANEIRNAHVQYADAWRPAHPDAPPPVPNLPSAGATPQTTPTPSSSGTVR